MVPSVLPWVPLPLPGAPNKINVRYFMKASGYTARATNREGKLFRRNRIDIDTTPAAIEANAAVDERENRVVATESNVLARKELGAALANDNVAGQNRFAAKSFYTETLADAIAAVLNAALSFLMCHGLGFLRF